MGIRLILHMMFPKISSGTSSHRIERLRYADHEKHVAVCRPYRQMVVLGQRLDAGRAVQKREICTICDNLKGPNDDATPYDSAHLWSMDFACHRGLCVWRTMSANGNTGVHGSAIKKQLNHHERALRL